MNYVPVEDLELMIAFGNTNFGPHVDRFVPDTLRPVVADCLLKILAGYSPGNTIREISVELGLLTERQGVLSKRGKRFLFETFRTPPPTFKVVNNNV